MEKEPLTACDDLTARFSKRTNGGGSIMSNFADTTNKSKKNSIFDTSKIDMLPFNFLSEVDNVLAERK